MASYLVLSGCTTSREAAASKIKPTRIFENVGEIVDFETQKG